MKAMGRVGQRALGLRQSAAGRRFLWRVYKRLAEWALQEDTAAACALVRGLRVELDTGLLLRERKRLQEKGYQFKGELD